MNGDMNILESYSRIGVDMQTDSLVLGLTGPSFVVEVLLSIS